VVDDKSQSSAEQNLGALVEQTIPHSQNGLQEEKQPKMDVCKKTTLNSFVSPELGRTSIGSVSM